MIDIAVQGQVHSKHELSHSHKHRTFVLFVKPNMELAPFCRTSVLIVKHSCRQEHAAHSLNATPINSDREIA